MIVTMPDFNVVDETWRKWGLLKIVRAGNAYEWRVYPPSMIKTPVFKGREGTFYAAQKAGEKALDKDLGQIFWILSEASKREREEGEPEDSDSIEEAIRAINTGRKAQAAMLLGQIAQKERAGGEMEEAGKIELARAMLMAEKGMEKGNYYICPECGVEFNPGMAEESEDGLKVECPSCGEFVSYGELEPVKGPD